MSSAATKPTLNSLRNSATVTTVKRKLFETDSVYYNITLFAGLYTVEKYWSCVGKAGFKVFKFALRRCQGQAPPPWIKNKDEAPSKEDEEVPKEEEDDSNKENRDDGEGNGAESATSE